MASFLISAPGEEVGIHAVVRTAGGQTLRAAVTGSPTPLPSLQQEEQQNIKLKQLIDTARTNEII